MIRRSDPARPRGRGKPCSDRPPAGTWARGAALTLAWEMCGLTQREVGRAFGVGPYAVAKAAARFGNRTRTEARLRKRIAMIKSNVQT